MYYRKYFAGSVEDAKLTRTVVDIATKGNRTEYYVIDDVVCKAIKETLEDAGVSCAYASENSVLQIDGLTVQFLCYSSATHIYYNVNGANIGNQTSNPFSGNNYKFYVTLKGDIDSVLNIAIGTYSSPTSESYGISIGKGKDLKDGLQIRATSNISNLTTNYSFYIVKNDEIFRDNKGLIIFGGIITHISSLDGNGTEVTLVECVAQPGRFKLDNSYFGNAALTVDTFYNIGGDIYYQRSKNILVKCVNKKISSDIVIRRGTAPTLEISVKGIDVTELESVCITLSQYRKEITKSTQDMTIDEAENILYVFLSQEDTLTLAKGYVHLQMQAVTKDGLEVASGIKMVSVEEI